MTPDTGVSYGCSSDWHDDVDTRHAYQYLSMHKLMLNSLRGKPLRKDGIYCKDDTLSSGVHIALPDPNTVYPLLLSAI